MVDVRLGKFREPDAAELGTAAYLLKAPMAVLPRFAR